MSAILACCKLPGVPSGVRIDWDLTWIGATANPLAVAQHDDLWIVTGDPTGADGRLEVRASWTVGDRTCRSAPAILRLRPA